MAFRSYGGLTSGCIFPEILSSTSGETIRRIRKSFGEAKVVRNSSITLPSIMGLGYIGCSRCEAKKFGVMFVFVRHAFEW